MTDIEAVRARLRADMKSARYSPAFVIEAKTLTTVLDAMDEAEARIARMDAALKPFAEMSADYSMLTKGHTAVVHKTGSAKQIIVGDLRRAAAARQEKP